MIEQKNKVNHEHPTYVDNQPKRELFRAVIGGTSELRKGETKYLPKYPAEADYKARLMMSTIDGVVAVGHQGLVGKVFHEEPDTSGVNPSIVPLLEDIDLRGNHFNVFARRAFESAFDGFSVILVDAPRADMPMPSAGAEQRQGIRPYWRLYEAKDVINWRIVTDAVTKKQRFSLLVLREVTEEPDGMFGVANVTRYRVYRHEQGGVVTQEVWREVKQDEFVIEMPAFAMPKLSAIPAAFIGEVTDEPWLLNESLLEVKAYQKESSFDAIEYLQIPIPIFKGRPSELIGQPMPYGSGVVVDISEAGDAFYMQIDAAGNASLKATIDGIKKEIASRLDAITNESMPSTEETATEVVSDDSKSQARLIVWAQQFKDALERALQFTAEFMGKGNDKGGEVILRTAWTVAKEQAAINREQAMKAKEAEIAATAAKANG